MTVSICHPAERRQWVDVIHPAANPQHFRTGRRVAAALAPTWRRHVGPTTHDARRSVGTPWCPSSTSQPVRLATCRDWNIIYAGNNNNNNNTGTMFMVLDIVTQSHCVSSPGSRNRCRTASDGCRPLAKPLAGPKSAIKLHPPSPLIITQPEIWYLFYHPTEGRRLSRPRWLVIYPDGLPALKRHPSK